jgi:hypothetical protein
MTTVSTHSTRKPACPPRTQMSVKRSWQLVVVAIYRGPGVGTQDR